MRKMIRKFDLDKKTGMEMIFFFKKDAFILVNKSLLILLADDTKKLANTGNNRVVNSKHELIIQSNLKYLGSRKQEKLEFHGCTRNKDSGTYLQNLENNDSE